MSPSNTTTRPDSAPISEPANALQMASQVLVQLRTKGTLTEYVAAPTELVTRWTRFLLTYKHEHGADWPDVPSALRVLGPAAYRLGQLRRQRGPKHPSVSGPTDHPGLERGALTTLVRDALGALPDAELDAERWVEQCLADPPLLTERDDGTLCFVTPDLHSYLAAGGYSIAARATKVPTPEALCTLARMPHGAPMAQRLIPRAAWQLLPELMAYVTTDGTPIDTHVVMDVIDRVPATPHPAVPAAIVPASLTSVFARVAGRELSPAVVARGLGPSLSRRNVRAHVRRWLESALPDPEQASAAAGALLCLAETDSDAASDDVYALFAANSGKPHVAILAVYLSLDNLFGSDLLRQLDSDALAAAVLSLPDKLVIPVATAILITGSHPAVVTALGARLRRLSGRLAADVATWRRLVDAPPSHVQAVDDATCTTPFAIAAALEADDIEPWSPPEQLVNAWAKHMRTLSRSRRFARDKAAQALLKSFHDQLNPWATSPPDFVPMDADPSFALQSAAAYAGVKAGAVTLTSEASPAAAPACASTQAVIAYVTCAHPELQHRFTAHHSARTAAARYAARSSALLAALTAYEFAPMSATRQSLARTLSATADRLIGRPGAAVAP